jgi:hypothetical protein
MLYKILLRIREDSNNYGYLGDGSKRTLNFYLIYNCRLHHYVHNINTLIRIIDMDFLYP